MSRTPLASPPGAKSGRRSGAPRTRDLELAKLAKALGHPARVAILRLLLEDGECQCGAIVGRLPLAQATVSQHLKVLKDAGLIRGEIDPPRVCYCANPEAVQRLKTLIQEL
jgi:DNA-binding transcriptional ArsR family regulator